MGAGGAVDRLHPCAHYTLSVKVWFPDRSAADRGTRRTSAASD